MAPRQTEPDQDSWNEQERRRRTVRNRRITASTVAATVVVALVVIVSNMESEEATQSPPVATGSNPSPASSQTLAHLPSGGDLEPGTYVASAIEPTFDASHRIRISVPEGYQAFDGWGILKAGGRQWVSASVVGNVYADACHWNGTLLDPPVGTNFDALVAALTNQRGLHASTPTDITLAGFAGKRMERTGPARINLADCDNAQFRFWLDTGGGERYTPFTGEHAQLWILDVDGVPVVIEAVWPIGASTQVRAELIQMVESVRIDSL